MPEEPNTQDLKSAVKELVNEIKEFERAVVLKKKRLMEEAKRTKLYDKIATICKYLGVGISKPYGTLWIYPKGVVKGGNVDSDSMNKERLVMTYDDYGGVVRVYMYGKNVAVLRVRSDLDLGFDGFVSPGDWVKEVMDLYERAYLAESIENAINMLTFIENEYGNILDEGELSKIEEFRSRIRELCSKISKY